jgi:uncharacterized damage-inducible protein DinB
MFTTVKDFQDAWLRESANTQKMFNMLTDESLSQAVTEDHRTIGRIAWHIITTIPEMTKHVGLSVETVKENDPVPKSSDDIKNAYASVSKEMLNQIVGNWSDESLQHEDNLYGEMWKRGITLDVLIRHEIHHRGQLTVLMRQAGLKVPGIYGPALEEWGQYDMQAPEV